jgi:hypothetical protein
MTLAMTFGSFSKSFASETGGEPVELQKGEAAPDRGVWMSVGDYVYLASRTRELMRNEEIYREALEESQKNTEEAIILLDQALVQIVAMQDRIDLLEGRPCYSSRDLLLSAAVGAAIMSSVILYLAFR